MTYETSKCQQTDKNSPHLLIFRKFHRHVEKSDNAIPNNFHFCVGRCGLEKISGQFLIQFHPQKGSPNIPVLTFLPVQHEGIFSYIGYEILIQHIK